MELGAVICLPRAPLCHTCPLARECEARRHGTQAELPPKRVRPAMEQIEKTLLLIRRGDKTLVVPSQRVRGFWEPPEPFKGARIGLRLGSFRHTILHRQYQFAVYEGSVKTIPPESCWWTESGSDQIALSTTARKALRCSEK
jgi:adenine-specific DNA glycosylase